MQASNTLSVMHVCFLRRRSVILMEQPGTQSCPCCPSCDVLYLSICASMVCPGSGSPMEMLKELFPRKQISYQYLEIHNGRTGIGAHNVFGTNPGIANLGILTQPCRNCEFRVLIPGSQFIYFRFPSLKLPLVFKH